MISDCDVWRTAHAMIEQFCDDAAMRVDALLAEGDLDGYRVWIRVLDAVKEIRASSMPGTLLN